MRSFLISILLSLVARAATDQAPGYDGFDVIWEDTFSGPAGSLPDQSKWIMQDWYKNLNGDFQTYTTSRANQQHTGSGSLVIIPLRDPSAQRGWTSGRLESAYTFTPAPGAKTIAEAEIKLGGASKSGKQGIWPAFWLLGDSHRKGTLIWPTCGEIDILENVNGEPKTQGVIHCDKNPGGICDEKNGIASALDLPDSGQNFHTYTAMIDRTPDDWRQESVSFFVDGRQYHRVTGDRIGNEEVWGKVAHNLVHFILNVAVGGEWPGDPNESTVSGIGNAMEVKYVAHYQSKGAGGSHPPAGHGDGYDPIPQPQPQPEPEPHYPEPPAPPHPPHEHVPQPPSPYDPAPPTTGPPRPPPPPYSPHDEVPGLPSPPHFPEPQFPGPHHPPYDEPPHYPWEQPPRQGRPEVPKPHVPYDPYDPVPEPPSPHFPFDPEPPSGRLPEEDYDSCNPHGPPGPEHDPHKICGPETPPHYVPQPHSPYEPDIDIGRPGPPASPYHPLPRTHGPHAPHAPPPFLPPIPFLPDIPEFTPGGNAYPPRPGRPFAGHHKRADVLNLSVTLDDPRPSRPAPVIIHEEQTGPQPFYPNQGGPHPPPSRELTEPVPEVPGSLPRPANDGQEPVEIPPPTPDFPPHFDHHQPQQPSHGAVPPRTGPPPQHAHVFEVPGDIPPPTPDFPHGDYYQPQEPPSQTGEDSSSLCPHPQKQGFNWHGVGVRDCRIPSKFNVRGLAASQRNASEPEVAQLSMPNRFKTPNYPTLASDATAPPTVSPGDFGGVQVGDTVEKRDLPNRFKTPNYPTLPSDGTPPTVRSGDFGGVQAEDIHKYLDRNISEPGVAKRSLPKPPNYPAVPPDSIRPVDICGVRPEDIRDYIEKKGPYRIEIPNNTTTSLDAVATPTAQPDSVKKSGIIGFLKEKFGTRHTKREESGSCFIGIPLFGPCRPYNKKHGLEKRDLDVLKEKDDIKNT